MPKLNKKNGRTSGFTLVELSIVIIIIGFLIAGISAGTSMIKSAELNAIITDFQSYQTAYNNFLGRYGQVPGDFSKASTIWGTNCGETATNCDGDGNGIIDSNNEIMAAWKQLQLANMISANIAVVPDTLIAATVGVNMPASKTIGAGYSLVNGSTNVTDGFDGLWGTTTSTNVIFFAKATGVAPSMLGDAELQVEALTAQEAYTIDKKIDDGVGYTGIIRAVDGSHATATHCVSAPPTNDYSLSQTDVACLLAMAVN